MSLVYRLRWLLRRATSLAIPLFLLGGLALVLVIWSPKQETGEVGDEIWTCSMHPQVRMTRAGRCPICGMNLIPLSQLKSEQERVEVRAGLETEPITFRELFKEIRTVGKLDYNERRMAYISARIAGRVDRVYADFTGIEVKPNDHLVDIYSPELYSAQAELLRARAALDKSPTPNRFAESNVEAARTKLRLLGILPEQIARVEETGEEATHLTIYAPIGGVVIEKNVREQQYVAAGDMLYRIAELDPIWLYLDIYEYDLAWIRYGQVVELTVEAYPGRTFKGTVVFIDPFLNDQTRTVRVRVNLKNPDYLLKPAMYASANIHVGLTSQGTPQPTGLEGKYICPMHPEIVRDGPGECEICQMPLEAVPVLFPVTPAVMTDQHDSNSDQGKVLSIRKSAVLDTGRRHVAYRKSKSGAYELVDLKIGPLAESKDERGQTINFYPVLDGLQPGDEVVIQGGFLLDSQQQIEGMPSLLYQEGQSAAALHAGHGGATPPASNMPAGSGHQH